VVQGYSNTASATFGQFDFILDFALKEPESQDANRILPDEIVCRLHVSPQHFKAIVNHMAERLEQYQEFYGVRCTVVE